MQTYILVFPRIGRNRELKKVLEGYWKGEFSEGQLRNTVDELKNGIGRFSMAQGFPSSLWATFLSAIFLIWLLLLHWEPLRIFFGMWAPLSTPTSS